MSTGFRSRVTSAIGPLVAALLLLAPGIGAQQGGTVTGRVLDARSGLPIPSVQVFIPSLDLGGLTQQNGRYLLQNVPAGTHTLTVARIGYRTSEVQVAVGGGQTVEQNFSVAAEALELDAIVVTAARDAAQRALEAAGLGILEWRDTTAEVAAAAQTPTEQARHGKLGVGLVAGADFPERMANTRRSVADGRLANVMILAEK